MWVVFCTILPWYDKFSHRLMRLTIFGRLFLPTCLKIIHQLGESQQFSNLVLVLVLGLPLIPQHSECVSIIIKPFKWSLRIGFLPAANGLASLAGVMRRGRPSWTYLDSYCRLGLGKLWVLFSISVFLSVKWEKSPCLTKILQESNEIQKAKSQHSSYMKSTL